MENNEILKAPMSSTFVNNTKVQRFIPEAEVCTKEISFVIEDGNIDFVKFCGANCEGNLNAITSMIEGMSVEFVMDRLSGIRCGSKSTSCVDQLCNAIAEHMKEQSN